MRSLLATSLAVQPVLCFNFTLINNLFHFTMTKICVFLHNVIKTKRFLGLIWFLVELSGGRRAF